ncbi:GreA/GreB family elongation factor [candidate division WOR-3 bacterium]|nr:GreA/GreB family elongation factor [candidate division WOR-3 bacterium]
MEKLTRKSASEALVRQFRTHFWQKQYEDMATTWLEMVEADLSYGQMLELLDLTDRQVPRETTALMLQLLADSLREQKKHAEEYDVLRRQAAVAADDAALARAIAACVQHLYSNVPDIEHLLHKSGVGYGQSLRESLPKLDRYLAFLPGTRVLDVDRGPGRVKKLDLLLDKVTVDFDRGAELVCDLGAAHRILKVCRPDGYYALLDKDRQKLLALAASRPGQVVALLLRDTGRAMSVRELQEALVQVVAGDAWEGFWTRARRELAKNPHVVTRTVPARTLQWEDTPSAKPASKPARAAKRISLDVDASELAGKNRSAVLETYAECATFPERRRFLKALLEARPGDWHDLYAAVFVQGKDGRARAIIEKELAAKHPQQWRALLDETLTGYRQNPEAFLWLVSHCGRLGVGEPKGVVMRILDLLESAGYRPHWSKFRAVLVEADYRLVQSALAEMDEGEAERLLGLVSRARILDGYVADEITQLVASRYPNLSKAADDNVVYTTAQGLEKARNELQQISEKEIPKVAEEIARARAHGDLSENYEYKAAKEKQGRLMVKAKRLRDEVARARTVGPADVDTSEVSVGSRVKLDNGAGNAIEYSILGPWDADPDNGVISYLSPFAQVLIGRKVGDSVEMDGQPFRISAIEPGLP